MKKNVFKLLDQEKKQILVDFESDKLVSIRKIKTEKKRYEKFANKKDRELCTN